MFYRQPRRTLAPPDRTANPSATSFAFAPPSADMPFPPDYEYRYILRSSSSGSIFSLTLHLAPLEQARRFAFLHLLGHFVVPNKPIDSSTEPRPPLLPRPTPLSCPACGIAPVVLCRLSFVYDS